MTAEPPLVITPAELLRHWQGHRGLTRRVIEAFPEDELFRYTIGGMRPFSMLAAELVHLADGGIRGLATGDWGGVEKQAESREELLGLWDTTTSTIDRFWSELPADVFRRTHLAFGQWEATGYGHVLYWIDNEVHHRGQGYVYLRALGIAPPAFYERPLS